jgi:hypothetical protein
MLNKILSIIMSRIVKEQPFFGSIYVRFYFHDGRFVKYDFDRSETTVINEESKNGKK